MEQRPPGDQSGEQHPESGVGRSEPEPRPEQPGGQPVGQPGWQQPGAQPGQQPGQPGQWTQPPSSAGGPPPPPPPPAYAAPGYGTGAVGAPVRNDGLAIGALVCSIIAVVPIWLFCYGISAIVLGAVGTILGQVSLNRIRASGGTLGGGTMANVGRILGVIGIVLGVIWLVAVIAFIGFFMSNPQLFTSPTP